jgi:RNA polymerase sigma-70 factor (ECF subfamily)
MSMLPRAAAAGGLPEGTDAPLERGAFDVTREPASVQHRDRAAHVTQADRARIETMFEAHHNLVWRTLRRNGFDAASAADIGQQAYLVALERITDIWPGSERAFLVGTALRISHRTRRDAARLALDGELEPRAREGAHPESHTETLELLDRVLAQLDRKLVEVFVLCDVEGFSGPEIAEALALPLGTVASRLRRAREAFRASVQRLEAVRKREEGER